MFLLKQSYRDKAKKLVSIMLPIICTQIAVMSMNFFDASMSGQAGNVDLAGAAIGGNMWMPIHTCFTGILMAAMPQVAYFLGAGENHKIQDIIRHGLFLAVCFTILVVGCCYFALPIFYLSLGLEPAVYDIAIKYSAGIGLGVLPFFCMAPLRNFVDTLGYTRLTMKIYFLALPINALLNYILIFGKFGLPRLGGVGAGIATGLTFWILFFLFAWVVTHLEPFKKYEVLGVPQLRLVKIKEYLKLGIPMGLQIFMETSVFGVVAFFIAKFGTDAIAAHQAALNFSSLLYMFPLAFSLSLTICIGVEYGGKRFHDAYEYIKVGIGLCIVISALYMTGEYFGRSVVARIYSSDAGVQKLITELLVYAVIWQVGDAIAAPIQGILRGYKDVNIAFVTSIIAYWGICIPVGFYLDYQLHQGMFSYWQSLDLGVLSSAILLSLRLFFLQRKYNREGNKLQALE
ncbi:MAG: MATE family efflux transporter [Phascolarctobacterium sp.]|nr:MATE family efflux transporter [Phascolarctobacterium sp.]